MHNGIRPLAGVVVGVVVGLGVLLWNPPRVEALHRTLPAPLFINAPTTPSCRAAG